MTLFDVSDGGKLWTHKNIRVGFEIEDRGYDVAVKRMAAVFAHCTVRYLYDCPKKKFKIYGDRSNFSWGDWEN